MRTDERSGREESSMARWGIRTAVERIQTPTSRAYTVFIENTKQKKSITMTKKNA